MESKYEAIWETHDFVINKLTENEAKYNSLLSHMNAYVSLYRSGELTAQEIRDALEEARKLCRTLRGLYLKHLLSIREIRETIDGNYEIPEERIVTADCIDDLETSTKHLMDAISDSENLFNNIEEDLNNE